MAALGGRKNFVPQEWTDIETSYNVYILESALRKFIGFSKIRDP